MGRHLVRLWLDRPVVFDVLLSAMMSVLVGVLWWTDGDAFVLSPWNKEAQVAVADTLGQLSATVGGFAGVVVVFGLTAGGPRMSKLRHHGGAGLHQNWVSLVAGAFGAAFAALLAKASFSAGWDVTGLWLGLLAFTLITHSTVRLVWLFSKLAELVHRQDTDDHERSDYDDARDLFEKR